MLRRTKTIPLDYSMCCMTVTVYHREGLTRQVLHNVHLESTWEHRTEGGITREVPSFLLVVPGDASIAPGDIVMAHGRKMAVQSVKKRYLMGKLCHTEARG